MRTKMTWAWGVVAALVALAAVLFVVNDDSEQTRSERSTTRGEGAVGGELIDGGTLTFVPASIDPALVFEAEAARVTNALYDGLTEWDFSNVEEPVLKGLVAESWESNDDGTEWTFGVKDGMRFSNGEAVLPSSFQRGWERAADPELEGNFTLFETIDFDGLVADDDTMTLTVRLTQPDPEFPALVSHLAFSPMPEAVETLEDQTTWDQGEMIGNGPFVLAERSDQEIVVVRNEEWGGDIFGNERPNLDRIVFRISRDVDAAWQAFQAGRTMTGVIPPGQLESVTERYGNTATVPQLANVFFSFGMSDPVVGGEENVKLRQAISLAIDRDQINELIYGGTRPGATGYTPPGVPGYEPDLCEVCTHDAERAGQLFQEWLAEGNELTEPVRVQFNSGQGHEDVVAVVVENLEAVGIDAEADPRSDDTYFDEMFEGGCQVCRLSWQYDYPSYLNGIGELYTTEGIFNLTAVSDEQFDELIAQARVTLDDEERWSLYREAEARLLNGIAAVAPLNWNNGDYAYSDDVENFVQTPLGLVPFELVSVG